MSGFDVIVVGTGGIGSAALYHAAAAGHKTLGLDRFEPGHALGSSHGQSRLIRQAYYEHPDYVPLALRSYELWHALEARLGRQLLHDCGLLEVGPEQGELVTGVLRSAREHGLVVERLDVEEAGRRFPGFRFEPDWVALYEPAAGWLEVENCVVAHLDAARALGAELRTGETVVSWQASRLGVEVRTDRGTYHAAALAVCAGPWAGSLLAELRLPLEVVRKPQYWFRPLSADFRADRGAPGFLYETPEGSFYGFPELEPWGMKVAEHSGGRVVADPLSVDRELDANDEQRVERFLRRHLPGAAGPLAHHAVCMYTLSPDRHFVVDRHPDWPNVSFVAGLSGHGFKFAPVLGQAAVELACSGPTSLPVGFLAASRRSLVASD